jgi:hypothetical protein
VTTVATITLESSNGDSVVVSAPNDDYLAGDIILDTDPAGVYDVGFTVRTVSGAFEIGGHPSYENVPIRAPILPFWLTPASRPRFQRLWGTPGNLQKVKCTWDGPSGPRWLILQLAKEIRYTTESGLDAAIDDVYHAVVSAHAYNPMYESPEEVQSWTNPNKFIITILGADPFTVTFGGSTTPDIAATANAATVRATLEALPSVGAGNVTVTGTPGSNWQVAFTVAGTLTGTTGATVAADTSESTGWFEVWNPTDQKLWLEWEFDPAQQWQFPDFSFGQERKWGRPPGADAARMIITPSLEQLLSVMVDPIMDTYVNADLSNAAGLFNGVEPVYPVPPYTGTEADPILMPVVCTGPPMAKATLRQRRFWSAESGLEA